jgi:hypothetical protein
MSIFSPPFHQDSPASAHFANPKGKNVLALSMTGFRNIDRRPDPHSGSGARPVSTSGEAYLYTGEGDVNEFQGNPEHDDAHEHIGYAFRSKDGQHVFSARLDGFDFSVGHPYGRWEEFRDEALRLWELFKKVSGVREIVRVAVRYINRIDIPTTHSVKLDHYLTIYPEVPDDWPSGVELHDFFMQLQAWQDDLDCNLIVNQAPARP